MIAAQIGVAMSDTNPNVGNLLLQGAGLGAQMVALSYGRDAELEADQFGMNYMRAAGYDAQAAISLQQKFLALSGQNRTQPWLVRRAVRIASTVRRARARNQERLAVGTSGELGAERYATQLASLRAMKPAYDKADEAMVAAGKKEFARARGLANEAAKLVPREPRLQQLLGDMALAQKKPRAALPH